MMNFYLPYSLSRQLPSVGTIANLSDAFIVFAATNPDKMIDDVKIAGVYGIPSCTTPWAAGRYVNGVPLLSEVPAQLNFLNTYGVSFCFTFTNSLITEKELGDVQGNMLMELAHNGMNSVIVASPYLEEYLRDRYPNYKYISSITKCETDVADINTACDKYDLVVPNHFYNKNFDFLKQIEHPEKIKLLIDSFCSSYCKKTPWHYRLHDKMALLNVRQEDIDPTFECNIRAKDFAEALKFKDTISNDDLYGRYSEMGFRHFKLEGRTDNLADVIASYVYYMVKPKYRDETSLRLTKVMLNAPIAYD